jgi:hypothetical protein
MTEEDVKNTDKPWSLRVAALAVDALVDARIVARADFELALKTVAGEIQVRLALGDKPF